MGPGSGYSGIGPELMTVQLFGVQPWDPVMLMIATLLPGVGALVASMIPAWRAACAIVASGEACNPAVSSEK
ncbi:MAG TPA: hypothetical protein VNY05_39400 [Candidatus Acidoferrales bacterium]|jgi:hypothetical protein|nr:hypothetical protein [Candidatus Acidoferrales bacterium]